MFYGYNENSRISLTRSHYKLLSLFRKPPVNSSWRNWWMWLWQRLLSSQEAFLLLFLILTPDLWPRAPCVTCCGPTPTIAAGGASLLVERDTPLDRTSLKPLTTPTAWRWCPAPTSSSWRWDRPEPGQPGLFWARIHHHTGQEFNQLLIYIVL